MKKVKRTSREPRRVARRSRIAKKLLAWLAAAWSARDESPPPFLEPGASVRRGGSIWLDLELG